MCLHIPPFVCLFHTSHSWFVLFGARRLVGGGEAGPPTSYKLAALDSAHVEIMRIGTYRKDWGGLDRDELLEVMASGAILIPQMEVLPTNVVANPDKPPELEIRFDMEEASQEARQLANLEHGDFEAFCKEPLPINWQIRFLHNQFFKTFVFPSRFCPGAFHSTILRKADFRSDAHRSAYFNKCSAAIATWRKEGPKPLNTIPRHPDTLPLSPEEIKTSQAAKDAKDNLEKFTAAIKKQYSNDTEFLPPTEEEEEAVAELVDRLIEMAPLSPAATTAKATANLEVSLDEQTTSDEDEEGDEMEEDTGETKAPEDTGTQPSGDNDDKMTAESTSEQKEIADDTMGCPETAESGNEAEVEVEPVEGDDAKAESTNDIPPEDSINDVQVVAVTLEATSEQQEVTTEKDADKAAETEEVTTNTESVSEAPTDDALAADSSAHSGSTTEMIPPPPPTKATVSENCHSGIWLFTDRENITHFFPPNFLPPYDTPEKKKIIFDVLKEEWDEKSLSWKPCGQGSMTASKATKRNNQEENILEMMSGVVSAVMDGVCSPKRSPRK